MTKAVGETLPPAHQSLRGWLAADETGRGWTALPRAALWFCVPALLAEGAAGISQVSRVYIHSTNSLAGALAGSAASIALLFGMLAVLFTPVAAALVLVASLLHRWRLRVIALLWLAVIVAMAFMLPAMDGATRTLMLLLRTGP